MSDKYIFLDPYIYIFPKSFYGLGEKTSKYIKEFSKLLVKHIDYFERFNIIVILDEYTLSEIAKSNPTLPFEKKLLNPQNVSTANLANRLLNSYLSNCIIQNKYEEECMPCNSIFENIEDELLDFFNLLLSNCKYNKNKIESNIVWKKSDNDKIPNKILVRCNNDCGRLYEQEFICTTLDVEIEKNKNEIVFEDLINHIESRKYNSHIDVLENEHSPNFNKTVKKFTDIPDPERSIFKRLNEIIDIKMIHFTEKHGSVSEPPGTLSKWKLWLDDSKDCSDQWPVVQKPNDYEVRYKFRLSCKNRGSKPDGVSVILVVEKEGIELLVKYLEAKNINIIDAEILKVITDKIE